MSEHNPQPEAFRNADVGSSRAGAMQHPDVDQTVQPGPPPPARASWIERVVAVLFCIFCFEVGAFLIVYPWLNAWSDNYLVQMRPSWAPFLLSHQFRGAVTGLGILNIFIAFGEVFRLRRFADSRR